GDLVVGPLPAHHGDAVRGHLHVAGMGGHVHARLAHGHVAGEDLPHLGVETLRVHADHVGEVVPHLVHHVMGHVAVHGPVPRRVGDELDGAGAPGGHQHGRLGPLTRGGDAPAVGLGDVERVAVQVDRVVIHRAQVAEAQAHALTGACH